MTSTNITSLLQAESFMKRLRTFIEEGAYFTKEGNYNTLKDFVPEEKRNETFGFSFPSDSYDWKEDDFSSAIKIFVSLLQQDKELAEYIESICIGNIGKYDKGPQIFSAIGLYFKIIEPNNKNIQKSKVIKYTLKKCTFKGLQYNANDYGSALSVANLIHVAKEIDGSQKELINKFLLNTYVGLCFILNKIEIKDATPQSPVSSNSSSSSNTSERSKGEQDNKPETQTEDKQPQKEGNADIPEPNQGERSQEQSENQKQIEGDITPNPELNTEPTPIDSGAKPIDIPEKVADVDEETYGEDNAKSPEGGRHTGSQAVGANEDGVSPTTPVSDEDKTSNNDDGDSNTKGQGDENDGAGSENKNDLPVLSHEVILEKLERYEAIYRTFYFDELKSFLTFVDLQKEDCPYNYLKEFIHTPHQDLASYGTQAKVTDQKISFAIKKFFCWLAKEGNENMANILLEPLSWCLSDISENRIDFGFCLKYGEAILASIMKDYNIHVNHNPNNLTNSNDSFEAIIQQFKTAIDENNNVKEEFLFSNIWYTLKTIRNVDAHVIKNKIDKSKWNHTVRFFIHTYIGTFFTIKKENKKKNIQQAEESILKINNTNQVGILTITEGKKNEKNPEPKVVTEVNLPLTKNEGIKLKKYQYYGFIWKYKFYENRKEKEATNTTTIKADWHCQNVELTIGKDNYPKITSNTRFAEYLTAYIREKFNVGVRLGSIEGSIANITRLMNGDEKDDRSIKTLLLTVLDKMELLGKEKSNVQKHIDEFSEQLKGITQTLKGQPGKITEGVISGIKEMNLPADITKSIMERIDPKLDRLVETTDNIQKDTTDIKDTAHRVEDAISEATRHTKATSDDVKELKEVTEKTNQKLSEIEKKLKNKSPQGEPANISDGNVAPAPTIQVGDNFTGTLIVGNNNGGNNGSGNGTPPPPIPTPPPVPKTPHTSGNNGGSKIDTKLLIIILTALLIVGIAVVLLLGKGSLVEQNVTVITGTEQVTTPKSGGEEPDDKPNLIKEKAEQVQPGQGASNSDTTPPTPHKPKPQPKVDTNYEAGMAAYNAGDGLEAVKKFKASNSAKANYMLGVIYENGCGSIAANAMMARKYYKIAEEKGSK